MYTFVLAEQYRKKNGIWKYLMIFLYFIHSFTKAFSKSEATGVFMDANYFLSRSSFPDVQFDLGQLNQSL